jgi:hypothetical protein
MWNVNHIYEYREGIELCAICTKFCSKHLLWNRQIHIEWCHVPRFASRYVVISLNEILPFTVKVWDKSCPVSHSACNYSGWLKLKDPTCISWNMRYITAILWSEKELGESSFPLSCIRGLYSLSSQAVGCPSPVGSLALMLSSLSFPLVWPRFYLV